MDSLSTSHTSSANSTTHGHGSGWHMWLMLLCCLVPIALFAAVAGFGIPFSGVLSFAVFLLCPLMMVFMMRGHGNGSEAGSSNDSHTSH
jgi:Protein of unknown function (DUF2933)